MMQIAVSLPETSAYSYPVWISTGLLEKPSCWMPKNVSSLVIITDEEVREKYASLLEQSLQKEGYHPLLLSFPAGEASKTSQMKCELEEAMLVHGCGRDTLILALGGGVVGDLAGFIAATYLRGIPYIQIPTTLLAMLDSSVGGKTGIDTPQGKNLIGAFWQPSAVVADLHCLKTLPKKQLINGLIEAIKLFLTYDAHALMTLQQHLDSILNGDEKKLGLLVHQAVTLKASVVQQDERENGQRVVLNLGHTIGHALEQLTDYRLLHGYAVALGLLVEAKIAQLMGLLENEHYLFIKNLLGRLNIFTSELQSFDVNEVLASTQSDKKKRAGLVHYVLLNGLGCVFDQNNQFAHPISDDMVKHAFLETIKD